MTIPAEMRLTTLSIDRWIICAPMEGNLLADGNRPFVLILLNIFSAVLKTKLSAYMGT